MLYEGGLGLYNVTTSRSADETEMVSVSQVLHLDAVNSGNLPDLE